MGSGYLRLCYYQHLYPRMLCRDGTSRQGMYPVPCEWGTAFACASLLICRLHVSAWQALNHSLSLISFLCSAQIVQLKVQSPPLITPSPKKRDLLTIKYGIIGPGVSAGEWLQLLQVVGTGATEK
jgi:hypothetical protein